MREAPDAAKRDGIVRILNTKISYKRARRGHRSKFHVQADKPLSSQNNIPPFPPTYTKDANPCKDMLR
jgi:hypothetical protein